MPRGVPTRLDAKLLTLLRELVRYGQPPLHVIRSLDERPCQARGQVPVNVTVEEPRSGVVGDEPDSDCASGRDVDRVAPHWVGEVFL